MAPPQQSALSTLRSAPGPPTSHRQEQQSALSTLQAKPLGCTPQVSFTCAAGPAIGRAQGMASPFIQGLLGVARAASHLLGPSHVEAQVRQRQPRPPPQRRFRGKTQTPNPKLGADGKSASRLRSIRLEPQRHAVQRARRPTLSQGYSP